jgi:anaerobic selenocysteine-containing dehydrogenase
MAYFALYMSFMPLPVPARKEYLAQNMDTNCRANTKEDEMEEWKKTGCILCAQNCGLEVLVENGRMTRVRPDKENPRSRGYACRKGLRVPYYQYPSDRLTEPLKRRGERFEPISWEQAIDEIGDRLQAILAAHGPRSLAYMGASAQGGHFEASFGSSLMRALGSQYRYSSAGQEFSGSWWVNGRMLGKQYNIPIPDEQEAEILVAWGWNGMQSHQMPGAPRVLLEFSKNPDKLLVVIDPRKSETAAIADLHLPLVPGTDALLIKAMLSIILRQGWENRQYINDHVEGFSTVSAWFRDVDTDAALAVCGLEKEQVIDFCRLLTSRRWCFHPDLGVYMGRHSALTSYLMTILAAVCGAIGVRGGNIVPGMVMPLGSHADERSAKVWRTVATGMFPAAAGFYPPAVIPEEIVNDHPDRLRAILINGCNPLRSYPDTSAYEKAFTALDLLVVTDIVLSETARLAHYVLPSRTFYESWDGTFFSWTYPQVYFQMRRPVVEPPKNCLEPSQIFTRLAEKLGLIPEIPAEVTAAAQGNRLAFGAKLMEWGARDPAIRASMVFILEKTLGALWDSGNKAALWGMLMTAPKDFRANAARAGFAPGLDQGERIFKAILNAPQGLWVGIADTGNPMEGVKTDSGKIKLLIEELQEAAIGLDAASESRALRLPEHYPLILNAGRHMQYNANTLMRNPAWNAGKRACTIAMHPDDAVAFGLIDGGRVRVTTEAGSETGELETTEKVRRGTVLIPHGFGLLYDGEVYGVNVNRLTKNTNRDFLGTPLHRYIPCRIDGME